MEELISTLMQNAIQNGETITPYEVEYTRSSMQREINNLRGAIDDFNLTLSPENADFAITNDGEKIGQFISLMKARAENGTIDFKSITQSELLSSEMKVFAEDMFLQNRVDTLYERAVDAGIKGSLEAAFVGLSAQEIAKTDLFKNHTIDVLAELGAEIGKNALVELFKLQGKDERAADAEASLIQGSAQQEVDLKSQTSIEDDFVASIFADCLIDFSKITGEKYTDPKVRRKALAEALLIMMQKGINSEGKVDLSLLKDEEIDEQILQAIAGIDGVKEEEIIAYSNFIKRKVGERTFNEFIDEKTKQYGGKLKDHDEIVIKKLYEQYKIDYGGEILLAAINERIVPHYQRDKEKYDGIRRSISKKSIEINNIDSYIDSYINMVPNYQNTFPEIIKDPAIVKIDYKGFAIPETIESFKERPDYDAIMRSLSGKDKPEVEQNPREGTNINDAPPEEIQEEVLEGIDIDNIPELDLSGADILGDLDQIAAQVLEEEPQIPNLQESLVSDRQEVEAPTEAQKMETGDTLDFVRKAAAEVTPEQVEESIQEPVQEGPNKPTLKGAIEEFQYQRKFGRGLFGATAGLMGNVGAIVVGSVRNSFSRIFNRQKALPPPINVPQEVKGISESGVIPQPEAELESNQSQQVEAPEIIPPGSVIPGIISHETRNSFIPRVSVDEKAVIAQMEARRQEKEQKEIIGQVDGKTPQEQDSDEFINDFQMD